MTRIAVAPAMLAPALQLALQLLALQLASSAGASSPRVVDRYSVEWATPASPEAPTDSAIPVGRPKPPTGPYAGNGDVTVMYSGNATVTGPSSPNPRHALATASTLLKCADSEP